MGHLIYTFKLSLLQKWRGNGANKRHFIFAPLPQRHFFYFRATVTCATFLSSLWRYKWRKCPALQKERVGMTVGQDDRERMTVRPDDR